MIRWPRMYVLDEMGEPLVCDDLHAWGHWMQTATRRVKATIIDGHPPVRISTVFLGLDHNFLDAGDPVLWETMVFGNVLDSEMRRYTSRAEALVGHEQACVDVLRAMAAATSGE